LCQAEQVAAGFVEQHFFGNRDFSGWAFAARPGAADVFCVAENSLERRVLA
jgi:hypothetical protein